MTIERKTAPRTPIDGDLLLLILLAKAPAHGAAVTEVGDEAARHGIVMRTSHFQGPIRRSQAAGHVVVLGTCYPGLVPGSAHAGRPAYRYGLTPLGRDHLHHRLDLLHALIETPAIHLGQAPVSQEPYLVLDDLDAQEPDLLDLSGIEKLEGWS